MGLSEREQQLLDDMERRLYQSEADVVQSRPGGPRRVNLRSLVLGILLGLVGVAVMIVGVAAQQLWLGLIGFAVMLGGAALAFMRGDSAGEDPAHAEGQGGREAARESFSERLGRRWDQRMDGER